MNCIADVSQRLQNALDSNYNVTDMSTVLEVITVLEGTTITKEQLETTRLAKYINQLRRKTSNDQLARRSKNLLKNWRKMVIPNQNAAQQQSTTNASLTHPSSAISPTIIPTSMANRLIGNTTLSNGSMSTTPNPSTWSSHSQGAKGAVISKENMIRRPMVTASQTSVQHKSSSMPMTTNPKLPLPILNTNNGSNSSLSISHTSTINTSTLNSTMVTTNRTTSAQPISFANLISQSDGSQHIDGPNKVHSIANSSNESPKMPKIPSRNNLPQTGVTTIENNCSRSPLFLMGNRTSNFRLPPHNDIEDANSRQSFSHTEHQSKNDYPNNNTRKTFNGFGNMFLSNATKVSPTPPVAFSSSDVHDSHSDSSSMIMAPMSSLSLPMTSTTATPIDMADSQKHKKRKRHERKKERDSSRLKDVTSIGGAAFDHSMSNSSSLGMFNSTTNTTNTTTLGNAVPCVHKLSELTFTGKFSKSEDAIINIDTSNSSSPKQIKRQRIDSPALMQDSPCASPMLSVDNSNESATADSLPKPLNDLLTASVMPMTPVPLSETLDPSRLGTELSIPIPKKRGRKKGSTGVDRNMSLAGPSGSIGPPYHGTVSVLKTKMDLMKSVKKVKTTKELLAELQNRKPVSTLTGNGGGSTNSSPMLQLPGQSLVSPSSLCSDNSQTNSTDMRSTTATPVSMQTVPTPEPHAGSDSLLNDQPKKQPIDSKLEHHKTIDDEIAELRRQLPPIDYDAVNNWTDHEGELICTCKLIELDPPIPSAVLNNFDGNSHGDEKVLQIEVKLTKIDEQLPKVPPDLSDSMRTGNSLKPPTQHQPQRKPPMKSIFDLDFDDEDDPIHRFKISNDGIKVELNVDDEKLTSESIDTNSMPPVLDVNRISDDSKPALNVSEPALHCLPPPPIPLNEPAISQRYEVIEDPHCPAKAYFLTDKNCVTQYHVDMLHNMFIPNVNGNWSVPDEKDVKKSESKLIQNDDQLDELEFVPKCNHMRLDKIPKDLRDFDAGWYRQRKLRKKCERNASVDNKTILPDGGNVDQEETEVISSRLSNSSQTINITDHVTESDGRDEQNCDLKTNCVDDGNVEDVSRVNELQAMDGQSEEYVASEESRKRKGSKRKSVKYKIRKSSSDFSRDVDGSGGQFDGIGDGREPKSEAPTRIILKFSRQVTTDAEMEEDGDDDDDDDDDEDETDDDDDEVDDDEFDDCEDDDENVDADEHEQFRDKDDDLVEYDRSNCHSNDNIKEICSVENNNDNNDKFDRNVDLSDHVMDVDHFKLQRFSDDDLKSPLLNNFQDDQSKSPSLSIKLGSIIPINHHLTDSQPDHIQPNLLEPNHIDSNPFDIATTSQLIDYDDNNKTAEQLPLDNNELLASFNNLSTENENGVRTTDGLEFKEWHDVVQVRSYNDELLTILPYVVID